MLVRYYVGLMGVLSSLTAQVIIMCLTWSGMMKKVILPNLGKTFCLLSFLLMQFSVVIMAQDAITVGDQVGIEYTLTLKDGTTVDTNVGKEVLVYTQGEQRILLKLQEALVGLKVGDKKIVRLAAVDAYGPINPKALQQVPIEQVPEDARKPNTILQASTPEGRQTQVRVREVNKDYVVIDGNHPLAGQDLTFDVKIVSVN